MSNKSTEDAVRKLLEVIFVESPEDKEERLTPFEKAERALENGTLTYDKLFDLVADIEYREGESFLSASKAVSWFSYHAEKIAKLFGQRGYIWFLLDCGANGDLHFAEHVVMSTRVLGQIEDLAWREAVASEFYLRHGAHNLGWIKNFLELGISRESIVGLLYARLGMTKFRPQMADEIDEFLTGGYDTWRFLTHDELKKALRICAKRAPSETYAALLKAVDFLPSDGFAEHLRTKLLPALVWHGFEPRSFSNLPIDLRLKIIAASKPFVVNDDHRELARFSEIVFDTALDLSSEAEIDTFLGSVLAEVLPTDDSVTIYRHAMNSIGWRDGKYRDRIAHLLDDWLSKRTDAFIGVVEEFEFFGRKEVRVVKDGIAYVVDSKRHPRSHYVPKDGDHVFIRLAITVQLAPMVYCAPFFPAPRL